MAGSQRQIYRTITGKQIDMGALRAKNADMIAVSNVKMNARGDILDANHKVVVPRAVIEQRYEQNKPQPESASAARARIMNNAETPAQIVARMEKEINSKKNLESRIEPRIEPVAVSKIEQDLQEHESFPMPIKAKPRKLVDKDE